MQVTAMTASSLFGDSTVAQSSQVEIFSNLFTAFLVLGTLVGVVVISYILYNVYKYRDDTPTPEGRYDIEETDEDDGVARPQLGEIPTGVGKAKGKKLFLSFAISAVIVVGLVTFAYWNLLIVEGTPDDEDSLDIMVEANSFNYDYEYPSGLTIGGGEDPLIVPENRVVALNVTACHPGECIEGGQTEVWHTWSSPDLQASTDAIPGQYTETWFLAEETGDYRVECRELCGAGHSSMNFDNGDGVVVKSEEEFKEWCEDEECMDSDELNDWLDRTGGEN